MSVQAQDQKRRETTVREFKVMCCICREMFETDDEDEAIMEICGSHNSGWE